MNSNCDLSVILPAYNEAGGIEQVVRDIDQLLESEHIAHEIICVENGSTDTTYAILQRLAGELPTFRLIQSEVGWGNAVKKGIEYARGAYICYLVSDGQVDSSTIITLYKKIKGSKLAMIKGFRSNRESLLRQSISSLYNGLAYPLFGLQTRDINGTPKIFQGDIARSLVITAPNIALDLELLLQIHRQKLPWVEVPVEGRKRVWGKSSTSIKTAYELICALLYFRFRYKFFNY